MLYYAHYSDKTYLKYAEVASHEDRVAVHNARRQYKLEAISETWVKGKGYTLIFIGPTLDEDTQNLCCVTQLVSVL